MISKKPILCFYATAAVIVLKYFHENVKLHIPYFLWTANYIVTNTLVVKFVKLLV